MNITQQKLDTIARFEKAGVRFGGEPKTLSELNFQTIIKQP